MNKLQYLFSEQWSVRRDALRTFESIIIPCITSGNPANAEQLFADSHLETQCMAEDITFNKWYADDTELPEGSVIVFRLSGMLYRWETDQLSEMVDAAESNPKVGGIIFSIDGPGGMAGGVPQLAEKIHSLKTPTATVVAGEMCSAHLWLGASADRVFVSSEHCEIGSLGTMTTFTSYKKYYERLGIEERDIYPDTADLKNGEYRLLDEKGDDTAIKERLERLHRTFAEHVAACRGIKADMEDPIFRGAVVSGSEAISKGLADEMGNFETALNWIMARRVIDSLPEEFK
ncbi:MAG: S49 family peptidase [Muribaculaceae bacterium]|nr:S49 family peptidase [Muribaculaceae bacterium]